MSAHHARSLKRIAGLAVVVAVALLAAIATSTRAQDSGGGGEEAAPPRERANAPSRPAGLSGGSRHVDDISADFPDRWLGIWRGKLTIHSTNQPTTVIPMGMRIAKLEGSDRYAWQIQFGTGRAMQLREYELVPVNPAEGEYRIDEKNSIVLSANLIGRDLTSIFTVQGNLIVARYRFEDDAIEFHITSGVEGEKTETGGGEPGVPAVFDIPSRSVQSATLTRKASAIDTPAEGAEQN